ncbi:MAG: CUAEP/CCAEP-tail radical SAM protein [Bryobacteraceae bacterium]
MRAVLISTYEMGRQPFGLASPAAWLKRAGHEVTCADLSIQGLPEQAVREADFVAFYLPMHTATRLAVPVIAKVKKLNPGAELCCFGLYAPLNEPYLRSLGVRTIIGGEFESELASRQDGTLVALERLQFQTPDRSTLPPLHKYAHLQFNGEARIAGYTEASRGCKHLCRHCPVVPVYNGTFRVVQRDVVLEDIRQQVAAGAQHITLGDPDFFNGPTHATNIVDALHAEFPGLTYDVTIKIEHLLKNRRGLENLKRTGCVFVTSAVEAVDDAVLEKLDKGHTRADFIAAVGLLREIGLTLTPTFIAFTPWTTRESYRDLLGLIAELDLIENVTPIQLALRLLIPAGSRMLDLPEIRALVQGYDQEALLYRWKHPDPLVDGLAARAMRIAGKRGTRREGFRKLWELVSDEPLLDDFSLIPRAAIPYMDEPWYC